MFLQWMNDEDSKIWHWIRIVQAVVVLTLPPAGYMLKLSLDARFSEFKESLKQDFLTHSDAKEFALDEHLVAFKTKANAGIEANRAMIQLESTRTAAEVAGIRAELSGIRSDISDIKEDVRSLISLRMSENH